MPPIGSLGQNNNNTDNIHKSGGITKLHIQNKTYRKLFCIISTLLTENTILKTEKKNQNVEIEELQLQIELYKATQKMLLEENKSLREYKENSEEDKNNKFEFEKLVLEFYKT